MTHTIQYKTMSHGIDCNNPIDQSTNILDQDNLHKVMISLLDQGAEKNLSKDYVTDQLFQLIQENIDVAREMKLPEEYLDIKKTIVEPHYCLKQGTCEKVDVNSPTENLGECLLDRSSAILFKSVACAVSIKAAVPTLFASVAVASYTCAEPVYEVMRCVDQSF